MPDTIGTYTEVDVCNLALQEVGRGGQIGTLDDPSQSARMCKMRYPYARDATLRAYDWNFAAKRVKLVTPLPTPPDFEWGAQFVLPDDCLLVRSVYDGCAESTPWTREGANILCNVSANLLVKYTALVTDPTKFDRLFVSALSCRLAAEIATTLTESTTRAEGLWRVYSDKLLEARRRDAQEGWPDEFPPGSWITSRYTS